MIEFSPAPTADDRSASVTSEAVLHEARSSTVSVVVASPTPACLYGLRSLVADIGDALLSGAAADMEEFLDHCAQVGTGVALANPLISPTSVRAFVEQLLHRAPRMRVVVIIDCEASHLVREALQAGASGLLHTNADVEEIRDAIFAVAAGRRYLSPVAAQQVAESIAMAKLTAREMDVLRLLGRGWANKVIARELTIEVGTVKAHVGAIMSKVGGGSRTEVVLRAQRLGLVGA